MPILRGSVLGVPEFERALEGFAEDCDDSLHVLEEIATRAFFPVMQARFDTEGFGRWRDIPLSAQYEARKKREVGDKPRLQYRGALVESLTRRDARGNVYQAVGRNTLYVGSEMPYARRQHDRFSIIELRDEDVDRMTGVAVDALRRDAEKRGIRTEVTR